MPWEQGCVCAFSKSSSPSWSENSFLQRDSGWNCRFSCVTENWRNRSYQNFKKHRAALVIWWKSVALASEPWFFFFLLQREHYQGSYYSVSSLTMLALREVVRDRSTANRLLAPFSGSRCPQLLGRCFFSLRAFCEAYALWEVRIFV